MRGGSAKIFPRRCGRHLNALYWSLRSEDTPNRFDESPDELFRSVMTGSMLFQGLTDQTLAHDQRWQFTQLAKYLERTDVTCRVIQTKYDILKSNEQIFDSTLRNLHWMAVLRSCCSIEAYRRYYLGDMDPTRVAGFLILERNFPQKRPLQRVGALAAISAIRRGSRGNAIDPTERILGRLDAQLEYAELSEILAEGIPELSPANPDDLARSRGGRSAVIFYALKDSSMLLKIIHKTELQYSDFISESIMELRMVPRQEQDQHRLSFDLAIGPATTVSSYFDWLGNTVHSFSVNMFHRQISIIATSVVETDRPRKEPERFRDVWPIPAEAYDYTTYDFLGFGGPIIDCPQLHELAKMVTPRAGISAGELALRILYLIDEKFTYKKGMTTSASPISDILATGYGVCQDFTHLMIALARHLKIPARYVSGFLHPDAEKYRGTRRRTLGARCCFHRPGGWDSTRRIVAWWAGTL